MLDRGVGSFVGRRWIGPAASLVVGLVAGALLFSFRTAEIARVTDSKDAVALAVGQTRDHDGMTFAEYSKGRYRNLVGCQTIPAGELHFTADRRSSGGLSDFSVAIVFVGEAPSSCRQLNDQDPIRIAVVDRTNGVVYPAQALGPDQRAEPTWLERFRAGSD